MSPTPVITPDQLQVGMYVHLDLKWFDHPFAFSHFKITSEDQIKTIRGLGLKTVRFSPELSEAKLQTVLSPLDIAPDPVVVAEVVPELAPESSPAMQAKRA
ncbi:MAG TPA: DUF3391 domain-containing protein, partial [Rhodoferax sp.]